MNDFIKWLKGLPLSDRYRECYVALNHIDTITKFAGANFCSDDDFARFVTLFENTLEDRIKAGLVYEQKHVIYNANSGKCRLF